MAGKRGTLSEATICSAALAIIDEGGFEALSMRALGRALGVDPMAVYHHVPGKKAILHRVVRNVMSELAAPSTSGDWQARVGGWANAYRGAVVAHPHLIAHLVTDPEAVCVAAATANASLRESFQAGGLDADAIGPAIGVVVDYVHGHVLGLAGGADVVASRHMEEAFGFGVKVIVLGLMETARQSRILVVRGQTS